MEQYAEAGIDLPIISISKSNGPSIVEDIAEALDFLT